MNYKACFYSIIVVILLLIASFFVGRCTAPKNENGDTIRIDSIVKHDTSYIVKHDTMPVEKKEKVIEYLTIPCPENDNKDSMQLAVVQKEFSDDSTYTAYVSGLKYNKWPKLDSINVRQKEITNTIIKTITIQQKKSRWSFGVQGGYGYGFNYKGFEPYIGVGIQYSF